MELLESQPYPLTAVTPADLSAPLGLVAMGIGLGDGFT